MVKFAFLFPGQGSQSVGMGEIYAAANPAARDLLRTADEVLGYKLSEIMFSGPEEKLKETVITQPALFLASAMGLELLKARNVSPVIVAGHSLGEYSALYAAGVLTFIDAIKLVNERAKAMQAAATAQLGTMAAVIGLTEAQITEICKRISADIAICAPANFNSESQIVISGTTAGVQAAMSAAKVAGAAKVVQLNVSGAFHSPLMTSAANVMREKISQVQFSSSAIPIVTNVDAEPTTNPDDFKRKLVEQIDHSVRWNDSIKKIAPLVDGFIEVGSGKVLGTMAKKFDRSKNVFWTDEIETLDKALVAPFRPS